VLVQLGDAVRARQHLATALRLNPEDTIAKDALRELSGVAAP